LLHKTNHLSHITEGAANDALATDAFRPNSERTVLQLMDARKKIKEK
jgi:hypothetical protein